MCWMYLHCKFSLYIIAWAPISTWKPLSRANEVLKPEFPWSSLSFEFTLNWCTLCCCVGGLFIFTWQALLFLQFSQTVRIWLKLLLADFGSVLEKAHRQRLLFTLFKWGRVPISYEKKIPSFSFFSFLGTIPANYVAWPTGTETKSVTKTHADTEFQRTF